MPSAILTFSLVENVFILTGHKLQRYIGFFLNYFHFFHLPSKLAIPVTLKKENQKGDHSNKELSIMKDTLGPKNIVRNCFYLDSY